MAAMVLSCSLGRLLYQSQGSNTVSHLYPQPTYGRRKAQATLIAMAQENVSLLYIPRQDHWSVYCTRALFSLVLPTLSWNGVDDLALLCPPVYIGSPYAEGW